MFFLYRLEFVGRKPKDQIVYNKWIK